MKLKEKYILIKNMEHQKFLYKFLRGNGVDIKPSFDVNELKYYFRFNCDGNFRYGPDRSTLLNYLNDCDQISTDELIDYFENSFKFKLNKKYEAIVTKDSVKVGCQEFSHDKIIELANKIKETYE